MSLFWRVYVTNAALLVVAALVLGVSPITVSWPIAVAEILVLALGLVTMLMGNALMLRPVFAPLERLAGYMRDVDMLRAGQGLPVTGSGEVAALFHAFNTMLHRLEAERRVSGQRALAAQETERKRVAAELHDEVGQSMTAVLMLLERARAGLPTEQGVRLAEAKEAVRASLEDVRRIASELRPGMLEHLGLRSALAALARSFSSRTGIAAEPRLGTGLPALDKDAELAVYRIVQESLTNVARHAGATAVRLEVDASGDDVVVRISDDGAGLPDAVLAGAGLRGIRERAVIAGAELTVGTSGAGGADLRVRVPSGERA